MSRQGDRSVVIHSDKLAPLEKRATAITGGNPVITTTKKKKKLVRFPSDDCEFYSNIWDEPEPAAPRKFIDILQVAHALTMIDYKSDYEDAKPEEHGNLWQDSPSSNGSPTRESDHKTSSSALGSLSQDSNRLQGPATQYKTLQRLLSAQGGPSPRSLVVPPPTKHESGRFIFSTVLSQLDVRDRWSSKFLLGLHEPVRHALYVINRFLELAHTKDSVYEWNTATFFSWFGDYFCEYIQAQHLIKATVLRPLMQIKYTAKREIAECYEEITFMLDAIKMHKELVQSTTTTDPRSRRRRLQALQEDIRKLNVVLYHVLNLEERALQPALISTFNEATFYRFVMPRVYNAARPKRLIIPWIIERSKVWGGHEETSMFKKQLSFPSRFLYDRVWYPHFVRHVVAAMKVLDTTMTEMTTDANEDSSWLGCVVQ